MIEKLESFLALLSEITDALRVSRAERISQSLKTRISDAGRLWLNTISTLLRGDGKMADDIVNQVDSEMERLYTIVDATPRRASYIRTLRTLRNEIQANILIPLIREGRSAPNLVSPLRTKILALPLGPAEKSYYEEAFKAAEAGCYKAAIVMIWCGVIFRLQTRIHTEGLAAFNAASIKAHSINSGPYRYFNKDFNLIQENELQLIADKDLIIVLSCILNLDVGIVEALIKTLEIRNNCGHPSGYSVEEIHFAHFVTEAYNLVLNNPSI